ncbi:hypothetical protein QE152_g15295 [Popillia japonica]|uniref:Uncharacterized protein n=1 Tax=Popillia japonica TaxID=7064 RepID=A0AAW1L9I1_POPJA
MMVPASFDTGRLDIVYKTAHLFTAVYLGFNSTALDIMYIVLMALCAAQLNILKERLSSILKNNRVDAKDMDEVIDGMLRNCVILHEAINR